MNKLSKELAERQGFTGPNFYISSSELEKFAELIVKDCIGTVENLSPGYQDYRSQIEDAFRRDCVEKIAQRFGVEE